MNFRQFRYFVGVVDAGSFSRAALSLHIAQPALSLQIANLEEELGSILLLRGPRGVQLTHAGEVFYKSARAVLNEINQVRQSITAGGGLAGDVSVGLTTTFSHFFAGPIAAMTRERHPAIRIKLFDNPGHLHVQGLLKGSVDIALLPEDDEVLGVERKGLYRQLLFFVERKQETEATVGECRLQDLIGRPLILPTDPNPTRMVVDRAFLAFGARPTVVAEANSMSSLLSLVEAGLGGAILAWGGEDCGRFKWSRIIDPGIHHDVSLCTARQLPHSECVAAVRSIVEEVVMKTILSPGWQGAIGLPKQVGLGVE